MKRKQKQGPGASIRKRRIALGLSQAELASAAGTSPTAISHIERGVRQPSADLLRRLAAALSSSLDDLVEGAKTTQEGDPYVARVVNTMKGLPPRVREQVADYCEFLKQRQKSRRKK